MTASVLPPGPTASRFRQGVYALVMPRRGMRRMRERYGDSFGGEQRLFGNQNAMEILIGLFATFVGMLPNRYFQCIRHR